MSKAKESFFEKYKHPEWQKMRLKIMERDNFECQECGRSNVTLNVHHKYYVWGKEPWDYSPNALITFCERCHKLEEKEKTEVREIIHNLLEEGYTHGDLKFILEKLKGQKEEQFTTWLKQHFRWLLSNQ